MATQGGMLSQEVVTYLMEQILSGEFQPGDKLPSERNLAEILGVSRTVVREAIKVLSEKGLVGVRVGKGAYVTQPTSQVVAESIRLLFHLERGTADNVIEIRKFLEIPLAGMAAQRARPENIEEMQSLFETMRTLRGQAAAFIEVDLEFHQSIARATQNPLFVLLIKPIIDLMQRSRLLITSAPRSYERSQHHHQCILQAVKAGDQAAAEEAMAAHLAQVEEDTALFIPEDDDDSATSGFVHEVKRG